MELIYIFVKDNGFLMDFDKSGPTVKFTLNANDAQDFDTVVQAEFIIKANKLVRNDCQFIQFVKGNK